MAGKDNLIVPTSEQAREYGRRGGIASAKSKKKKADLKKSMELLLSLDVQDEKTKKQLEDLGLGDDNQSLLAFSIFQQAVKGNQKAVENLLKLTNAKDRYDIAEQRERTKALKLENEAKRKELDGNSHTGTTITIVDRWSDEDETTD